MGGIEGAGASSVAPTAIVYVVRGRVARLHKRARRARPQQSNQSCEKQLGKFREGANLVLTFDVGISWTLLDQGKCLEYLKIYLSVPSDETCTESA